MSVTTTQFTGTNLRSAVTDGLGNFWGGGGAGGIVYLGINSPPVTLSTVSPATRNLNLVNGKLYYTTGSGQLGIMAFTGAPTSAATPCDVPEHRRHAAPERPARWALLSIPR